MPLFDAYRRFYEQPGDEVAARAFLRARLAQDESVILLARLGGEPAGFTQLYPSFSSVSLQRLWILNDLFVAEHARRCGVASALLLSAREHAIATNAKGLVLETATTNKAGQALYASLGWQQETAFITFTLTV